MRQSAQVRLFRALLVSAVVVSLAAAGHLAGGGTPPPVFLLVGAGVGVLGPVVWLAAHRLTLPRVLLVLAAAQVGLHGAFTASDALATCFAGAHGHHRLSVGLSCLPGAVPAVGHHELTGAWLGMVAGHVAAGVVTAVVLARTDAGLWWASAWLRPLVTAARPPRLPVRVRQSCPSATQHPGLVWRGLRRDRVRGPPAPPAPGRAVRG